ncbi:hypothetical protein Tco_0876128 [Tanacetum coccineum]|uniref:Uncharacterized protein n=1 Tax=Tanacetum coccineum TaxID=301880 RepID=A0ABQ5BU42_9ASTR
MNRKEVMPPIIDNNDVSYQRAKPAFDDNRYTRTTPSASSNNPPTSWRQPSKHKQTDDGTQTSQPHRRRRLTFVTETQRLHNDTNSTNNTNMTTATEPAQQQSMRRCQRTLSNSIPIEYIQMGNCTYQCHFCGAKFWECEKNVRSGVV